ncbi:hypothetical protein [Mycolicibacterium novocastrense]|uniref:hypothetical protein n=1 Tax=Mycolicibacterium novocastrense TaxID=59813 RepID=UPI00105515D6|nr:hypothetical protein [Mycolicibacterium novocastrense]
MAQVLFNLAWVKRKPFACEIHKMAALSNDFQPSLLRGLDRGSAPTYSDARRFRHGAVDGTDLLVQFVKRLIEGGAFHECQCSEQG